MMKCIQSYALVLILFSSISCGKRQPITPIEKKKTESQQVLNSEAPKSITRNIIQDKKGNIWMATWEGIIRYDGKSFVNMTKHVSDARFFSILEDSNGNFWFGTIGSGLYHFDGKTFRHFTINEGLLNNNVTSIYEDKKGNIWFGVFGGASCYDGKSFRNFFLDKEDMKVDLTGTIVFKDRPSYEVNSIVEDKSGKFWFATRGNTFVYDGKTFTVVTHENKAFTNVRTIIEDKKGNIWLAGSDGLWRYNGSKFFQFAENFFGYIIEDKKGNIWTSSEKDKQTWSLSKYDANTLLSKNPKVSEIAYQSMIFGILEDGFGNIWFGAEGVYRFDGKNVKDFLK